ncbi:MAG TPA: DNA methylase [Chloroflexi bacterium]|nr:DNA methylase [Chloroflexota bacterium]
MTDRRLIEEELPLKAVNAESAREKSLRHGNISTMHLWWARRPLAMSRATVFGTLLPDPGNDQERKAILDLLAMASPFEAGTDASRINPLRQLVAAAYPDHPPKVLDCFAGGGAIPLEALRLGCHTTAVDLNPVAFLLERCVLEYPQRYGQSGPLGQNPLAEDFLKWADWVRARVEPRLAQVFPADANGKRPSVYFWARTMVCRNPACRAEIPLLSSMWLANSTRRTAWVKVDGRPGAIDISVKNGPPPGEIDLSEGTVKASSVTCPGCGTSTVASDVRAYAMKTGLGRRLYAILDVHEGLRTYREPRLEEIEGADALASALLDGLAETSDGTSALPDESITKSQFRVLRSLIYGIDTFRGLFNDRQLYVLGSLCAEVRGAYQEMLEQGMEAERAVAVATYLGLLVDRIADYNSSFCGWNVPGEKVGHTFPRQAIAMVWDYVEIDPFQDVSGSWDGAVRWIELAIRNCSESSVNSAEVVRADAQRLPFEAEEFDAVIVDPPYYDAIQYGDLSDFFYVWLKRSVGHLHPEAFSTPLTPKHQEVIESRAERSSPEYISHDEFERRLQRALGEIARVVKRDGIVAIVFAHTDVDAWERLLRALRIAQLVVTTSWPMRTEMAARSTAAISAVLGSSVVLVCRPRTGANEGFYDDVVRALEQRINERLDAFEEMGLAGADYFVSAIGPAFEVFAQYSGITKLSGEEVGIPELMVLARQAVARHAMRRLLGTDSLATLDAESLFYLTWRWAYATEAIPADEAYKLEKAFDVDLGYLCGPAGLARRTRTSFALLGPAERRGIKLTSSPTLIDVLHLACQLWDAGRRRELDELLGATRMGIEPGFWSMARALAEILPDGNKERTMLLGLTSNRDALSESAARSTTTIEELTLFEVGPA